MDDLFQNKYRKRPARLSNWDYGANGQYFVTICADQRHPYFGQIEESGLVPSKLGEYAIRCWGSIPEHYPFVQLDEFILMPDHLHGILSFGKKNRSEWKANQFGPQHQNLATVVRGFKMAVTSFAQANAIEFKWQSRYFDRVIRNDYELDRVREYIRENPVKWVQRL
jgi:putative transposase